MRKLSKVLPKSLAGGARQSNADQVDLDPGFVRPLHRGTLFTEAAEVRMWNHHHQQLLQHQQPQQQQQQQQQQPQQPQPQQQQQQKHQSGRLRVVMQAPYESGKRQQSADNFNPIQKRNLVIQKTTEDLLQGSKFVHMKNSSRGGHGSGNGLVAPERGKDGSLNAMVDSLMDERRRSSLARRRTQRLSQVNLRKYNEKVHVKEKTGNKSFGQIAIFKVGGLFTLCFVVFAGAIILCGFRLNQLAGPAWLGFGIAKDELEKRVFLDDVQLSSVLSNLMFTDPSAARAAVNDLTKINCVVFSIMVQVTTILIQVGAKEFSANAIILFVSDKALVYGILFYTMTLGYMVFLTNATSDTYIPRGEILIASVCTLVCVLALIPYFLYLSRMLNPLKLVRKVADSGLKACTYSDKKDYHRTDSKLMGEINRDRQQAIWAVENICQFGINAMKNQRSQIAYTCVEVLSHFLIGYGANKDFWNDEWFTVSKELRDTPNFFSLTEDNVRDLEDRRCWLEWKVLRQYQNMFQDSLEIMKDVAYVIAVNTRRIAEACARRHDYHAFEYCVRFFNTYIRHGIARRDAATVHNILHQYRLLCTTVLCTDLELANLLSQRKKRAMGDGLEFFQVDDLIQITGNYVVEEARDIIIAMEKKIISMAQYLVYYSTVSIQHQTFIVSATIAHELSLLCESAFLNKRECHQEVLLTFLMQHEAAQEKMLRSVTWDIRIAQIKLATFYAACGGVEFFYCIQKTFEDSPKEELVRAWRRLERVHDREFWEVNDRGTNMEYLSPEQKAHLPAFFGGLGITVGDLHAARSYMLPDDEFFGAIDEEASQSCDSDLSEVEELEDVHSSTGSRSTSRRSSTDKNARRTRRRTLTAPGGGQKEDYIIATHRVTETGEGSRTSAARRRRSSLHEMLMEGKSPVWVGSNTVRAAVASLAQYRDSMAENVRSGSTEHAQHELPSLPGTLPSEEDEMEVPGGDSSVAALVTPAASSSEPRKSSGSRPAAPTPHEQL